MKREATFTADRGYAIRVCSDDEAEAWDEALRQEGVERERIRIASAVRALRLPHEEYGREQDWNAAIAAVLAIVGETK